MAVTFRGLLHPNVQWNPNGVLEVRFNRPLTADGVTILIKELDTYTEGGVQVSEGSQDDLLATFTGRIRNRRFQPENVTNASSDASLPTLRIKFEGTDDIYTMPIVTETGETEGMNWEIGFTVQYAGQDDYNSPVAFIPRALGRLLVVDNTIGDLSVYEAHANLTYHRFTSRGMEGKIIRGARSNTSTAHYNAADTTDYAAGFDRTVFGALAGQFDYIYFNCHGDVELVGIRDEDQYKSCIICDRRFSHERFSDCTRYSNCMAADRGYYSYRLRTNDNARIRVEGSAGSYGIEGAVSDWDRGQIVGTLVDWEEYKTAFNTANPGDPNVLFAAGTGGAPALCDITIPNFFQFPSLLAFPTNATRPDFREDNIVVVGDVRFQSPDSDYLHDSSSEDVPGVPTITFREEGGPLSADTPEINATPNAAAGAPPTTFIVGGTAASTAFASPPTGLTATPYNGLVELSWNPVQDAHTYDLYWSTSPGVQENSSQVIKDIEGTDYEHRGLTNGQTYYYRIQARKAGGSLIPDYWGGIGNLSRVKVMYAGCCLAGRKTVFAEAVLRAGAKYFIGHQVVTGRVAESLINRFWEDWLNRGAIIQNVIHVFNDAVRSNAGPYGRTRPVAYYRDTAGHTRYWRPTMAVPDPSNIMLT